MSRPVNINDAIKNTVAIILAGGSGTRLKSLTRWHSKPAVPFGGKYKTIDFPLSNCINSNIRKISILTQYKSHSLNMHINNGWSFLRPELNEFVELVPAQQRIKDHWYQGTADAVYQSIDILQEHEPEYVLILAGDHIYKMDYSLMLTRHLEAGADMTIGCIEAPLADARSFGVMTLDENNWITGFQEKPQKPTPKPGSRDVAMASMGIYVCNADFLYQQLLREAEEENSSHDFGRDIIPRIIGRHNVCAYNFLDEKTGKPAYWRDVGTVDAFYEANIELCLVTPQLNLYDRSWPILTYQEQLPPAKFVFDDDNRRGMAVDSLVSAGCIISGGAVCHSVLFNNVRVNSYSTIEDAVILNNARIGRGCKIRNAIIDRDCHIPPNTVIGYNTDSDRQAYHVSPKGVVLVSKEMLGRELHNVA